MKKILSTILIIVISLSIITPKQEVQAASKYIKVDAFIKSLVTSLELEVDKSFPEPYLAAAVIAKILKGEDFGNDFTGYITRTDAAVLLNRADEYLHGDTLNADLLKVVLEKRISDIKKIDENKREAVAKVVAKGIIKGYSNGNYAQDRKFKGSEYITSSGAETLISATINLDKRAKISPDGQLIRTTNLPKYANYYPYILESYPNAYYDWKFEYEGQVKINPETNKETQYIYLKEYSSPVDIDKITDFENFKDVKKEYLNEWVYKTKTYMECVFNADYRTIDDEWINKIVSVDYSYGDEALENQTKEDIFLYIKKMKENKTIIESSKIAVEGSSLYYYDNSYYLRVYVKYRIVSSKVKYGADADTLIAEKPYNSILYTRYPLVSLNNYTIGNWKESFFDVELTWYSIKSPDSLGVFYALLNEVYYEKRRVDK